MKIIDCEQRTTAWHHARCGIVTASDFDKIVTPEFAVRKGEMPKNYCAEKVAEKVMGWTEDEMRAQYEDKVLEPESFAMTQGKIVEEIARPWFALEYDRDVRSVGFIAADDGRCGCSPDGLGDGFGVEIKCPAIKTHVRYLCDGVTPKEYLPQIHFSMYVTGLPVWWFVSFSRHLPKLVIEVKWDEDIQGLIHAAMAKFNADFDAAYAKIKSILPQTGRADL